MNQQCCWIILPTSQKESCFRLRNTYQGIVEKTFLPLLSGACSELSRVPPPSRSSPTQVAPGLQPSLLSAAWATPTLTRLRSAAWVWRRRRPAALRLRQVDLHLRRSIHLCAGRSTFASVDPPPRQDNPPSRQADLPPRQADPPPP